ncbi:D-alanyl-D-alanine carboxypeptidase [Streptomyces qaidamensis]|uniref:D-alanyl-D-alanine carboxypeptidase n=1 Tax=Streptomyces qaidamensis TaxID=1783515 RepID=A0A143C3W5_9ACTN|nr:D-alanyl-D-alanine carboxypeptidase/D-alanyl-D-alanine-endopeptidase [Streptomyces qaidamensis]AMW12051.1 D-alanyl-D-alanine carboxypeptidase [Streptomyces qaidamensis]
MVVPELRPWRAAKPYVVRLADAVRPRLARAAAATKPRLARLARAGKPQVAMGTRPKTWQYTAGAATAGLALTAGVVTAAGPWDSSGQRTAERDRAVALGRPGGTDHGSAPGAPGRPRPAPSAGPVLTGLGGVSTVKSAPDGKALTDALTPLLKDPALGPRPAAAVIDVTTGRRLFGKASDAALTPASTTKVATAVAALSAMGADHRLTTRAALEPDTKEVVLVGGGDPTLTARKSTDGAASLRTLAAGTAAALADRGVREVTLSYDTTRYAGDEMHPIGVDGNLARVTPLMADEGRTNDSVSGPAQRVTDPAADAARRFGEFLKSHGIKTTAPGPSKATTRAKTLAAVSSPPLSAVVERMLTNSDNDIAEALARQTAIATGNRADFAGAGKAISSQLRKLGLPVKGAAFKDGSGLNRADRLTPDLLTALLAKAADPSHPELRPALTGLPVAGFTGTLTTRYTDGASGVVRAKTGTLSGVHTLAGTLVDEDGRLLAFAFMATDTDPGGPALTQQALDRIASALAACGCR